MNIREAKEIIKKENLDGKNFFRKWRMNTDEVAIIKKLNGKYDVFTTNERMGREGLQRFSNESDALNEYIERLRADKDLKDYIKERETKKKGSN